MNRKSIWKHFDFWLLGAVLFLCIFGIAMVQSAVAGNIELQNAARNQAVYVAMGMVIIVVMGIIDYHLWGSLTRIMYFAIIIMLLGINIIGEAVFGSARWFRVGIINIQPSELAKIVVIIVLARFFSTNRSRMGQFRTIVQSLLLTLGIVIWILLQPNLSTSIVVFVLWFAMLWISGVPVKTVGILSGAGVLIVIVVLVLVFSGLKIPFIQDYQLKRVRDFVAPDPNATYGETYNVNQARITIGSGGLLGMGYGNGTHVQLQFLKVRHTDFIFSAMAEEFGFIGTVFIMAMLLFVIFRCLRIARRAADDFGALIAYGVAVLLFFQMAVNIGVNLNIIPVTGLTLPFISYGGSSLLSLVLGIGLVEGVAVHS